MFTLAWLAAWDTSKAPLKEVSTESSHSQWTEEAENSVWRRCGSLHLSGRVLESREPFKEGA